MHKKNVTKHEDNKLNVEKSSKARMSHLEKIVMKNESKGLTTRIIIYKQKEK
jgi:hypothetical protein